MKAYIFPGQGSQFAGMGKELYEQNPSAREIFEQANDLLGFRITDLMFNGTQEDLKQTKVTQPAIFIHSVVIAKTMNNALKPDMVAGHSLGEFSALVANGSLTFEDGLNLVIKRANAMQTACELSPSTMAAIIGADEELVEEVCSSIDEIVVPANYNCPGQLVISGSIEGINKACEVLKSKGVKRALVLNVGGAFHSPLMEPAGAELQKAIQATTIKVPFCPIYQNVNALATTEPETIRANLTAQLTSPVKWSQTIFAMIKDGATSFKEIGPGNVLQGLVRKIDKNMLVESNL